VIRIEAVWLAGEPLDMRAGTLLAQRQLVPTGSATMKAIDYSLKRWAQLIRFVDDADVPISNNWVENHIRPIAVVGS